MRHILECRRLPRARGGAGALGDQRSHACGAHERGPGTVTNGSIVPAATAQCEMDLPSLGNTISEEVSTGPNENCLSEELE